MSATARGLGLANLFRAAGGNAYVPLLDGELAELGLEAVPGARFEIRWLWRSRHEVSFLRFSWGPDDHYVWKRPGGSSRRMLSWLRLAAFAGRLAVARALGYRIVWTIHEVRPPHSGVGRRLDRAAAKLLARAGDALFAHDPAVAERARRELGGVADRIDVVPHGSYLGVYPEGRDRATVREELGIPPTAFAFLCFGQLRRDKAVGLLLEAFRALPDPKAVLVVAGPVEHEEVARDVVRAAAADPRIRPLLGFVEDDHVAELFGAADAAVLARGEAWTSGSVILALSLGVPAVAARLPSHERLLGHERAGWLFEPGDAASLGDALRRAGADAGQASSKRASARAEAERLPAWSQTARSMAGAMLRAAGVSLAVAVAACAAIPARAAAATGSPAVSARPALYPSFSPEVSDYVSRCGGPRTPLRLRVAGRTRTKRLRHGQATTFRVDGTAYHVRCLPPRFPRFAVTRTGTPQAAYYVTAPLGPGLSRYVVIFDSRGVPVWWTYATAAAPFDAKLLPDGNLAWTRYFGDFFGVRNAEAWEEHRLDGSLVRTLRAVGNPTDTHDMEQLPNGHYMVDAYRKRRGVDLTPYGGPRDATVYDGELQELTAAGKRVWSWSSKDHIGLAETGPWWPELIGRGAKEKPASRAYDVFHFNSVEPDGNGFVISGRHTNAVYRIDKATGDVTWKVGGTHTPRSLTVVGDPFGEATFGGQHDARLWSDGSLTVHDNGTAQERPPRAVRFAIDPAGGTATLLEDVRNAAVDRSGFAGSARKLPGGNWVISWGGRPLVTEQAPDGAEVMRIDLGKKYSFRAFPVPRGEIGIATLRRAMDRMSPRLRAGPAG